MWQSLRSRLLLSYSLLIAVMLVVIGFFLLVVLAVSQRSRLLPQIETLVRADREITATLRQTLRDRPGLAPEALQAALVATAGDLNTRLLIINRDDAVLFDSRGRLQERPLRPASLPERLLGDSPLADENARFLRFNDNDGETWLGLARRLPVRVEQNGLWLVTALREATPLTTFQNTFLAPLLQAGVAAFVVAVLLAWLISRSVARPLQVISSAAEAIAEGDYDQALTPAGPREVRRLAESFNRMVQRVHHAQQSQRDFVANVSHDLQTPLTSIQGWSQALLDGTANDPARLERAAGVIHEESARMSRMVSQLLALARLEAGQEGRGGPVSLAELIEEVGRLLAEEARRREISLQTEVADASLTVIGERDQLVQMVTNLADNALRHTPAGGRVVLKTWQEGATEGVVAVQDTGRGIPPAELPRIFERFYQVDKARAGRLRGTGLGLSIVRQIAERHGGRVTANSIEGAGSLFSVYLPLHRA